MVGVCERGDRKKPALTLTSAYYSARSSLEAEGSQGRDAGGRPIVDTISAIQGLGGKS